MSVPIPVIRLEVEYMKRTMMTALSEYTAQMDEMLHGAVEKFCTPDNLERIIQEETNKTLDIVIREQVRNWFVYGEGREVIKRAVEKRLQDGTTWTPLDSVK